MSKAKVTNHVTGVMDIKFMAVARPLKNMRSGKEEYSIKGWLDSSDGAISHLREIADYKVDTKTNRDSDDKSRMMINFTTTFTPKVLDQDSTVLEGSDVPFFDGRVDSGKAIVTYSVIDYGDNKIVRLSGVKLLSLNLTAKEENTSLNEIENLLKNSG